jgi:hypothetical protein
VDSVSYKATVYRVLISAPSDVIQELKAVVEVIALWNGANAPDRNVLFEPVHWRTHSYPAAGDRPQAILNKQIVEAADALVALFWTRLGTPTGTQPSGSVEEIEELVRAGKPVLVYFSNQPVVPGSVDLDQYQKLKEYQKQIRDRVLYTEYSSVAEFRELLAQHLSHIARGVAGSNELRPVPTNTEDQSGLSQIETFLEHLEALLRRYSVDWTAERQSQPVNTDEAKWIMKQLADELLSSRSQITHDENGELTRNLDTAIATGRKIRDHMMLMDGGRSYEQFWTLGEEMLASLQAAIDFIRKDLEPDAKIEA